MQEEFEHVNMVSFLPIRDEKLQKLMIETDKDDSLQKLKSVIIQGLPGDKKKLPGEFTPYYSSCDDVNSRWTNIQRWKSSLHIIRPWKNPNQATKKPKVFLIILKIS